MICYQSHDWGRGGEVKVVWHKKSFLQNCHHPGLDNGHKAHNDMIKYSIMRSYTHNEIQCIQHCISLTSQNQQERPLGQRKTPPVKQNLLVTSRWS